MIFLPLRWLKLAKYSQGIPSLLATVKSQSIVSLSSQSAGSFFSQAPLEKLLETMPQDSNQVIIITSFKTLSW
jgi:hypothetical protein